MRLHSWAYQSLKRQCLRNHGQLLRLTSVNNFPSSSNLIYHQQLRFLDLQEYQSKQLLHEHGVQVQRFKVVGNEQEIQDTFFPKSRAQLTSNSVKQSRWSGFGGDLTDSEEYVIKAQVLAGGRGKGRFKKSGLQGGVILTKDTHKAADYALMMLNDNLVTKQTSSEGVLVKRVMIAEAVRLKREYYAALLLDRSYDGGLLLVTSPYGGMDIEEVAEKNPEGIRKFTIPIDLELDFETTRRIVMVAFDLKVQDLDLIDQCAKELIKLQSLFLKLDATQIEINPLGVTNKRQVISVDAKIKFDENARFKQAWQDELEELNKDETDKRDYEAKKYNLNFIGLDGKIGCLVNGAGLAMATMDIIKLHGGEPANFLDVGGGASVEQVYHALRIVSSDVKVRAIFVNIFGGIMRCDIIAEGIIQAAKKLSLNKPIICRLQGTQVDEAHKLIKESNMRISVIDDLDEAVKYAVKFSN